MSLYNADGQCRITIVPGTSLTGLYAADGSYNVVLTSENTTIKGLHHPCGAYWGTVVSNPSSPSYYAIDGSMNIIQNADSSYSPLYPAGSVSGPTYDPDAVTLFAAMTTPPTTGRKTVINNLILSLKSSGVWSGLDIFYVMAAADSQAASLNWKSPSTFTLVPTNAPTFTTDRGFTGDGATSRLSPSWIPASNGVNYTINNGSAWLWSLTSAMGVNAGDIGSVGGTNNGPSVSCRTGGGMQNGKINDSDASTTPSADGSGFFGTSRINATTKRFWKNGVQAGADITAASTSPSITSVWVCGANSTSFSARQQGFAAFGASLAGLELAFYSSILTYMQAVGAA